MRDRAGASAVEFGLLAPVLALMLSAALDTGLLLARTMEVNAAAQAGADFALARGWDPSGIQNAVRTATGWSAITAPAPTLASGCASGGTIAPPTGAVCPGGEPPGQYVVATAEAPFSTLTPWPGILLPDRLSAQALVRIE